ncbi:MAG TPA: type II toxin-antitoxin system Phd/YefM family antitoxin [Gammaproteobacteria bacterium]|nr:type II toxin-antitoxin system Phd/YefM family antitoxin [Gammaproteobacteria bacterium]
MRVTMAELNKSVNAIINRALEGGETVTVFKHGKPVAEIRPLGDHVAVDRALEYLSAVEPVAVRDSIDEVIAGGRQRGF